MVCTLQLGQTLDFPEEKELGRSIFLGYDSQSWTGARGSWFEASLGKQFHKTPILKNPSQNKGWWSSSRCRPS
jgi:hypothetical protein